MKQTEAIIIVQQMELRRWSVMNYVFKIRSTTACNNFIEIPNNYSYNQGYSHHLAVVEFNWDFKNMCLIKNLIKDN